MTPVKKTLEKVEAEENPDESPEEKTEEKKTKFEGQLTQLEATFTLDKVKQKFFIKVDFLVF